MFTGIIEELGQVRDVQPLADGTELRLHSTWSGELALGESVAINGACLTVVRRDDDTFTVQAGFETLRRTNLGRLRQADRVNLERAVRVGDRLGGHFVSGHVDTTATITRREPRGEFEFVEFRLAPEWTRQMVPKGSIAVDGISLTLVDVLPDGFTIMLIPHTLAVTTLGLKSIGDTVNIETDILAKYVQKQLSGLTAS